MQVHNSSLLLFLPSLIIAIFALLGAFASIPFVSSIHVFWVVLLLSVLGYVLLVLFKLIEAR